MEIMDEKFIKRIFKKSSLDKMPEEIRDKFLNGYSLYVINPDTGEVVEDKTTYIIDDMSIYQLLYDEKSRDIIKKCLDIELSDKKRSIKDKLIKDMAEKLECYIKEKYNVKTIEYGFCNISKEEIEAFYE